MRTGTFEDKKIAVIGIGGVGGYLAAMLSNTYPQISLVARGERKEAVRKNKVILHSCNHGEITGTPVQVVESASELDIQDYIFICVKNYSLEAVCKSLAPCVGEHTVIVPVMNGADPGDRVRSMVSGGTVIDSLIYIVAFANPDYTITDQGTPADIRIGIQNASTEEQQKISSVEDLLTGAGITCKACEDIQREIWKKFILNCAYNVETAYYMNTIGELRKDPAKAREYEALLDEAYQVAKAKGIHITQEDIDEMTDKFYHVFSDDSTSSLQRDMRDGKKAETDTFAGYLVREAEKYGIAVPVSKKMNN